jgi:hypoxanthine phosphoribosyltransferase
VARKSDIKLLIPEAKIKRRVAELARRITEDYKGKIPIFIGVLNGAFVFMADLLREVKLETEVDFLKLSSYGDRKISTGNVRLLKDLNCTIANRDILVIEDIVDSGVSAKFIRQLISNHQPASLEFATLLYKKELAQLDFRIKYIGFPIPDKFVVGYGLDYAQKYRNLKSIYSLM